MREFFVLINEYHWTAFLIAIWVVIVVSMAGWPKK